MKFSVSWHEECLKNFNDGIRYREEEYRAKKAVLEQLDHQIKRMTIEANFRKAQIEEARRLNREDYDADKFMSNKNPLKGVPNGNNNPK